MTIAKIVAETAKHSFRLRKVNKDLRLIRKVNKTIFKCFDNDPNLVVPQGSNHEKNMSILDKISQRMKARQEGKLCDISKDQLDSGLNKPNLKKDVVEGVTIVDNNELILPVVGKIECTDNIE